MAAHHHHESLEQKSQRQSNNNIMVSSSSSAFVYTDVSSTNPTTIHNNNFDPTPEIFHLTSGLEMIGFQPKPLVTDPGPSKPPDFFPDHHRGAAAAGDDHHSMMGGGAVEQGARGVDHHHHQQQQQQQQQQQMGSFMDESLRACVFSCEGNERPSQGLSLSLSSSNPSTIGLQSFELRHNHNPRFHNNDNSRDNHGFMMGKSQQASLFQGQQEFFIGRSGGATNSNMSLQFEVMKNSKYMGPAQELLREFCNLGTHQNSDDMKKKKNKQDNNNNNNNNWGELLHDGNNGDNNGASSSSSRNLMNSSILYGLSFMELQKRKTKLLGMLEELDRRYKHYCEQMRGVVSSFETVGGAGSANCYTTLASKAMSRHFRCLRDSIVAQIKATKKAMGEKDGSSNVPGTTKGETPRLRILDQTLRQQRAYQQMTMMETHPWRPQRGLPERAVSVLRAWLFEHFLHPYPSDVDKHILARQTGLTRSQVSNWFINARVRLWKPMVEQMYLEESKEQQENNNNNNIAGSSSEATHDHLNQRSEDHDGLMQDQKPDPDELARLDPDSLASIIHTSTSASTSKTLQIGSSMNNMNMQQSQLQQHFGRVEGFGSMDLAHFSSSSSYNHHHSHTGAGAFGAIQNDNNTPQHGFGGGSSGGNNVSLTLGLQQHGGNGVSLAFSSPTQGSMFYGRGPIDECQPSVQYSLLDDDDHQGQNNLPYRNLMGAQLLHDFA